MKDTTRTLIPNFLLGCAGGFQYLLLKRASQHPRQTSAKTLRSILRYAEHTIYGQEHHFTEILAAKTDEQLFSLYRHFVSTNDYEDLRPYVERHKNGECDVLFPGQPLMYATTSGTTQEPKWIPITKQYLTNIYGKMTKVWLFNFLKNRHQVFSGKIVSIVGKVIEGYAPDGTIFGSVSGVTQRDCPRFVKRLYASPADIFSIADYKARYYTIMRMGIERNVTLIVTANPSTIVEMQNNVNEFYDQYVDDIEHGTLNSELDIAPEIRAAIAPYLRPNKKRAKELRALRLQYGHVLPKHYWPNLQILNTWKCGNTRIYLDKFKDSFPPKMLHQEFGYFASECRFGLVLDDTNNTVLFPHMHYYEFIAEEDLDNPNPRFLQLDELQAGKRYCPFVTTFAGLYRYNMNDLLEAGPCFGATPTVHMIQKVNGIVSLTGEKLHERQFIQAVRDTETALRMPLRFFVGFADIEHSTYHFYYEFEKCSTDQSKACLFTQEVDERLQQANIEYQAKRQSFRLKDPVTYRLQKDSFENFKAQCIAEGARDGQFKMNLLMQDDKREAKFQSLVLH